MEKIILDRYKNAEEKLLLSKIIDKIDYCKMKNKIQVTHFLDIAQKELVTKFLTIQKQNNYILTGGYEIAERKVAIFYPDKLEKYVKEQKLNINEWIKVIRITLPNEMQGKYEHSNYLGALMKLGIKREMIGDILVYDQGADIIIHNDILKFLIINLPSLTRFQKAIIEEISLSNLKEVLPKQEEITITVSSMRLDNLVAQLSKCSKSKAIEYLLQEKVFVNFKAETKATKEIKCNDRITIRGKGRFEIKEIIENTKKGKHRIKIMRSGK